MTAEQLQEEAAALHHVLAAAAIKEESRRDLFGNPAYDLRRYRRLERLTALAADRWRRRCGYEWRRVPAGVRGSRGMLS